MTISSQGLRPAAFFRSTSGLRQTALNRAEILPRHDLVQDNQRILLDIETAIALVKVEKTKLPHSCPPLPSQHAAPSSKSRSRKMVNFSRCPYAFPAEVRPSG